LLSRFYERFADHAVIVGRRVTFLVTGTNIGGDLARAPVHTAGPGSDRSA
jgi:phosphate uptake regulator